MYVRKTNKMHTLFPLFVSFILSSARFETNKFIIRRLLLYEQHIVFSMHVYDVKSPTRYDFLILLVLLTYFDSIF